MRNLRGFFKLILLAGICAIIGPQTFLRLSEAIGADPAPPPFGKTAPDPKGAVSTSPIEEKAALTKRKKSKYRKSKLTRDESEALADRRTIRLTTGEDKIVDLDFQPASDQNKGVIIGNPKVVTYTLVSLGDKRQIVFKPLSSGETTVTLRDSEGTIQSIFTVRVTGSNLLRVAGEIRDLLRDVEGLNIRIVGQKVVIEGEVLTPNDYAKLLTITQDKVYQDLVINMTGLSPLGLQFLAKRIQEDINTFAPNVRTRVVNGLIFLEGTVDSQDQANRSAKIALLYMPEEKPGNPMERDPTVLRAPPRSPIQNFIIIQAPPPKKQERLVRVTVHFVELTKDYNKVFGFTWKPGFTDNAQLTVGATQAGAAGANGGSFTATISSLIPKLNSAQAAGYARILKTGTVVVRSGQPATLEDHTDFPIAITGPNGQVQAATKEVGFTVGVTPFILGQSEDIQLDMKMTQSNVNRAPTAGGTPIVDSHKVDTKVYVRSNESAAVAGVTASDVKTFFNSDPPDQTQFEAGTTPLFNLTRSKNYQKKKTQFVIFVTPQILDSASEGTEDLKKNFRIKVK